MALKAFISLAVLAAVVVGLLMPVPGHHKPQATRSSIATIEVN
jgi:hypothetical protein